VGRLLAPGFSFSFPRVFFSGWICYGGRSDGLRYDEVDFFLLHFSSIYNETMCGRAWRFGGLWYIKRDEVGGYENA
jgi:hypothetical protein